MSQASLAVSLVSETGGNTISPVSASGKAKKEKKLAAAGGSRSRSWAITINFDPAKPVTHQQVNRALDALGREKSIFQHEEGATGNHHWQVALKCKTQRTFNSVATELYKHTGVHAHIEECGDWRKLEVYCGKAETRYVSDANAGPHLYNVALEEELSCITMEQMYPWQKELHDKLIENKPNDRTIFYYYDTDGNIGKTAFCRFMCIKYPDLVMYLSGKGDDMKYAVAKRVEAKKPPKIILIDIPRSADGYVSWGAIEAIKNGIYFNGKYEADQVLMNHPHILCMANFAPDTSKLSEDRWFIVNLTRTLETTSKPLMLPPPGATSGWVTHAPAADAFDDIYNQVTIDDDFFQKAKM